MGWDVVVGLQGRYLIPLGPIAFLLLYGDRGRRFVTGHVHLAVMFPFVALTYTVVVLLNRYYF